MRWRIILPISLGVLVMLAVFVGGLYLMATGEADSRGYVLRESSGQLVVGYRICSGESIESVTVTDQTVSPAVTLWSVVRSAGQTGKIPLGKVPGGFGERDPFVVPAADHTIRFEITGTSGTATTVQFVPSKLPAGQFWDAGAADPAPVSKLHPEGSENYGC
ncbi:hypothetical protein [Kribbella sp. NPDC006257]|uniref:hypothetical protein n=1 Tax=Kribbella sp. NPDC006257 TaxID=3156738 RepID=UPI0033A57EC8